MWFCGSCFSSFFSCMLWAWGIWGFPRGGFLGELNALVALAWCFSGSCAHLMVCRAWWIVGAIALPCFKCILEQHASTPYMSRWHEACCLLTALFSVCHLWQGSRRRSWPSGGLPCCCRTGMVCLSPSQSKGNLLPLLGLGVACPSVGVGAWTWEYRVCMG